MQTLIFGAGGCGRSLLALMRHMGRGSECAGFMESAEFFQKRDVMGLPVFCLDDFKPQTHQVLLALGTGQERAACRALLPSETVYATCVHPQAFFLEPMEIPEGCIIYPMTYFSRNIQLGKHALIMSGSILGHDLRIGADFTCSAHVSIGGGSTFGKRVYCGLRAAVRDHISLCDDVFIAMGAGVTADITVPGTYLGTPARLQQPRTRGSSHFV